MAASALSVASQEKRERFLKWLIVAILVLCLFNFIRFIQEEIAPYFPVMTDQGYYLKNAHQYWDYSKTHGYWNLLKAHFSHDKPALGFYPSSNLQMSLLASLLFPLVGATRAGALSIHIFSWLVLLTLFAWVLRKITNSWFWPALGVALLLSTSFSFVSAGGIADFRMEFPAACWTSISLLAWCWFLQYPKKHAAWMAAGLTFGLFSFRLISIPYWILPITFLLIYASFCPCAPRIFPRNKLRSAQIPILCLGMASLVLLIWNQTFIKEYYLGAFLAEVPLKSMHSSTWKEVLYYPKSLWESHFGRFAFVELGAIFIFRLLASAYFSFSLQKKKPSESVTLYPETLFFCFSLVLSAICVLSLSPHRTPQHAGIVAPSLAIGLVFLILRHAPKRSKLSQTVGAALLLVGGFLCWQWQLLQSAPFKDQARREEATLNHVFDSITTRINRLDRIRHDALDMPNIVFLDWVEGFSHNSIFLYGREHLGYGKSLEMTVPRYIFTLSQKELLAEIHNASVVVMPENSQALAERPWPIMQSIRENFAILTSEVQSTMKFAETFQYHGVRYRLYFSPLLSEASSKTPPQKEN